MLELAFETRIRDIKAKIEELKDIAPTAAAELMKTLEGLTVTSEPIEVSMKRIAEVIAKYNDYSFDKKELRRLIAKEIGFTIAKSRYGIIATDTIASLDGLVEIALTASHNDDFKEGLLIKNVTFRLYDAEDLQASPKLVQYKYFQGAYHN